MKATLINLRHEANGEIPERWMIHTETGVAVVWLDEKGINVKRHDRASSDDKKMIEHIGRLDWGRFLDAIEGQLPLI